jgi:1-acyl-sn-glycerol-3-phosphate acyltransferase
LLHLVDRVFSRVWHKTVALTPPKLPASGAAILVCNHTSGLDPLLVQSVADRVIVWMMAKEYYEIRALTWIFRAIEVIPVDREANDTASVRAALRQLKNGRILGVFPEGRIETSRELLPFQTGAAMLAIRTRAPVYPVFIDGSQRGRSMLGGLLLPHITTLVFGPEIDFDRSDASREKLDAATHKIEAAVEALRQRALKRV